MGPAYMFSRGLETLRINGYLTLVLLTHGNLKAFHRLMKYGDSKYGDLLLQMSCRTKDTAGVIPLNAEPVLDRRGKKSEY